MHIRARDTEPRIRFNLLQGPYRHFEEFVGSKTTYRLINHKWADAYTVNSYLQLEKDVTLVVSRTDWKEFLKVQELALVQPFVASPVLVCLHVNQIVSF